jgi:hypothetical protein
VSFPAHLHLAATPLPLPDMTLAVRAHDLVELGAWLLAAGDASLLTIALSSADRDGAMPVVPWNDGLAPDLELARSIAAPEYRFAAVTRAAQAAADALFAALRPRWPHATPPAGLAVVTDGTGLGFSPDDPCPLAPGWMARRRRDTGRLTCLIPFAPAGAWPRLTQRGSPACRRDGKPTFQD